MFEYSRYWAWLVELAAPSHSPVKPSYVLSRLPVVFAAPSPKGCEMRMLVTFPLASVITRSVFSQSRCWKYAMFVRGRYDSSGMLPRYALPKSRLPSLANHIEANWPAQLTATSAADPLLSQSVRTCCLRALYLNFTVPDPVISCTRLPSAS